MELEELHLIGQALLVFVTLCLAVPGLARCLSRARPVTSPCDVVSGPKEKFRVRKAFQVEICHWISSSLPVMLLMLVVRASMVALRPVNRIIAQNTMPALDAPCFFLHATCLLLYAFPKLVRPSCLEFWYILIQSYLFVPFFFLDADHAAFTNRTLPARLWTSILSKHTLTTVAFNLLHAVAASTGRPAITSETGSLDDTDPTFSVQADALQEELTESILIIMIALGVRWLIYKNCKISLELQDSSIELSAVSRLLHGFCDAVVEMDQDLKLNESGMEQLSTLLLQGAPGRNGDFLTYFCDSDQARVKDLLTRQDRELPPVAMNAQLLDSNGSGVNVELLHVMKQGGHSREGLLHLVGVREFQDVGFQVAPLTTEIPDELSLVFSALDLKLLHAEDSLLALCRQQMDFEDVSDLSLTDFSSQTGPSSLCGQVQGAINRYIHHSEHGHQTFTLRGIRVLDRNVTALTLDRDNSLGTLIGTLIFQRDNLLTPQRLADRDQSRRVNLRPGRSRGRRSRSSRSSRSSSGSSPSSGRLSELHGALSL